jgi:hypothetical protein
LFFMYVMLIALFKGYIANIDLIQCFIYLFIYLISCYFRNFIFLKLIMKDLSNYKQKNMKRLASF